MARGWAMVVDRSLAKLGEVGEFWGVFRRTYDEMGVYAISSESGNLRLSGRRERRPRKDALMGESRGEVESAWDGIALRL